MPPLCLLPIEGRKDTLRARHFARQFAHFLRFSAQDEACIAAGAFFIAGQLLQRKLKGKLVFRIENQHLQVFAQMGNGDGADSKECEGILRLSKHLPQTGGFEELDLGWMVRKTQTSSWLFDEICKQNQEILNLLHELQVNQTRAPEGRNPNAA